MDKRKDVAFALAIAVFGLVLVVLSRQVTVGSLRDPLGPRLLPTACGVLLFVGGAGLAVRRLVRWKELPVVVPAEGASEDVADYPASTWRAMTVWLACFLYAATLERAGFMLLTPVLVAVLLWLLHLRNVVQLAVISVVSTLALYGLFDVLLNVRLPHGPLSGVLS
jgi:hypothetical protein